MSRLFVVTVAASLLIPQPSQSQERFTARATKKALELGNNGGQLPEAVVRVVDKKSGRDLPIFVYESELKEFWNDLSLGVELTETSKWTREENRLPPIE